jgi:hypothetical protein
MFSVSPEQSRNAWAMNAGFCDAHSVRSNGNLGIFDARI